MVHLDFDTKYQLNYMVISNNWSLYSDFYVALWAGYFPWLLAAS